MTAVTSTQSTGNGHLPPQVPSIPLSPDLPTPAAEQSIGTLVRDATAHLSTLIRSEVELAKSEVVSEVRKGLKGSVYFVVALTIGLFSLFFFFLMAGEVLDIWLWRWLAFAIVFAVMLLAAAVFALLGYRRMRSIRKPERTIQSLQDAVHLTRRDDGADRHED
ncbi:MAG TPA: phage holin family protein [Pseudonocardiaceae bacterium]